MYRGSGTRNRITLNKIVLLNVAVVFGIGLYGLLTDEPYWRDNGHGPWLYDYLLWTGLALNGPAGFVVDQLPALGDNYLFEYALWMALLWPQWKVYNILAEWWARDPGAARSRSTSQLPVSLPLVAS